MITSSPNDEPGSENRQNMSMLSGSRVGYSKGLSRYKSQPGKRMLARQREDSTKAAGRILISQHESHGDCRVRCLKKSPYEEIRVSSRG